MMSRVLRSLSLERKIARALPDYLVDGKSYRDHDSYTKFMDRLALLRDEEDIEKIIEQVVELSANMSKEAKDRNIDRKALCDDFWERLKDEVFPHAEKLYEKQTGIEDQLRQAKAIAESERQARAQAEAIAKQAEAIAKIERQARAQAEAELARLQEEAKQAKNDAQPTNGERKRRYSGLSSSPVNPDDDQNSNSLQAGIQKKYRELTSNKSTPADEVTSINSTPDEDKTDDDNDNTSSWSCKLQ